MLEFETLLFLHIPKTAGMTFKGIVSRQFNDSDLHYVYADYAGHQYELDELNKCHNLSNIRAVMGHFYYGLHRHFSQKCAYVTFVRNPVYQVLSSYNHLINSDMPFHKEILAEGNTLEEFILTKWASNTQTLYISGVSYDELNCNPQETLQIAKNNLKQHFLAVGITERFNESIFLFKHLLKWKSVFYYSCNLSSQRTKKIKLEDLSLEIINKIKDNNKLDFELYEFCNQLLDERISQIPLSNIRLSIFQNQYNLMKNMMQYRYLYNLANLISQYW